LVLELRKSQEERVVLGRQVALSSGGCQFTQLAEERERAAGEKSELESRLSTSEAEGAARAGELEAALSKLRGELAEERERAAGEKSELESRLSTSEAEGAARAGAVVSKLRGELSREGGRLLELEAEVRRLENSEAALSRKLEEFHRSPVPCVSNVQLWSVGQMLALTRVASIHLLVSTQLRALSAVFNWRRGLLAHCIVEQSPGLFRAGAEHQAKVRSLRQAVGFTKLIGVLKQGGWRQQARAVRRWIAFMYTLEFEHIHAAENEEALSLTRRCLPWGSYCEDCKQKTRVETIPTNAPCTTP
jgi:hypothetical protein